MFRLANFDEETRIYKYLSSIASDTICQALDNWMSDEEDIKALYENEFEKDEDDESFFGEEDLERETPAEFFKGISEYISADGLDRWSHIDDREISADGRVGMEIISRKINRMKEKMSDPDHFYTFDLFEELLFYLMTDFYETIILMEGFEEEGIDIEELDDDTEIEVELEYETEDEDILETFDVLMEEYGLEEEEAMMLAYAVYRPELMGIDPDDDNEDSLFFWDEDFLLFFQNGFVPGIQLMVSGMGSVLGYEYVNVKGIFTDIGLAAPIRLIGTETAYNIKREAIDGEQEDL